MHITKQDIISIAGKAAALAAFATANQTEVKAVLGKYGDYVVYAAAILSIVAADLIHVAQVPSPTETVSVTVASAPSTSSSTAVVDGDTHTGSVN